MTTGDSPDARKSLMRMRIDRSISYPRTRTSVRSGPRLTRCLVSAVRPRRAVSTGGRNRQDRHETGTMQPQSPRVLYSDDSGSLWTGTIRYTDDTLLKYALHMPALRAYRLAHHKESLLVYTPATTLTRPTNPRPLRVARRIPGAFVCVAEISGESMSWHQQRTARDVAGGPGAVIVNRG